MAFKKHTIEKNQSSIEEYISKYYENENQNMTKKVNNKRFYRERHKKIQINSYTTKHNILILLFKVKKIYRLFCVRFMYTDTVQRSFIQRV